MCIRDSYWATVTVAFALGTAVGDFTATVAKLGYFGSGLLFTGLILLPALGFWLGRTNSVLMFWIAYVLTRPLGASYADWMGKPKIVEGLGWGSGSVALEMCIRDRVRSPAWRTVSRPRHRAGDPARSRRRSR